jgi:hypothetical protein
MGVVEGTPIEKWDSHFNFLHKNTSATIETEGLLLDLSLSLTEWKSAQPTSRGTYSNLLTYCAHTNKAGFICCNSFLPLYTMLSENLGGILGGTQC